MALPARSDCRQKGELSTSRLRRRTLLGGTIELMRRPVWSRHLPTFMAPLQICHSRDDVMRPLPDLPLLISNSFRRSEKAVHVFLRGVKADVIISVPGHEFVAIRNQKRMPSGDPVMVARVESHHEAVRSSLHCSVRNSLAFSILRIALAARKRIGPSVGGLVCVCKMRMDRGEDGCRRTPCAGNRTCDDHGLKPCRAANAPYWVRQHVSF